MSFRVSYHADTARMLESPVKVVAIAHLARLASAAEIYARLPLGWQFLCGLEDPGGGAKKNAEGLKR